jgi:aldose 1-epimerase
MRATRVPWGTTPDGHGIDLYTLQNDSGMTVTVTNLGASVISVDVPDCDGNVANVNLAYSTPEAYADNPSYFGAIVGRYGNRIARGRFTLDGRDYTLAVNNGPNHLHGGVRGFTHRPWQGTVIEDVRLPQEPTSALVGAGFHYLSPDGEEGYPGTLSVFVTYTLHRDNRLSISYEAETDSPTVLNLTNHCYWNLAGAGSTGDVREHVLQVNADRYLAYDSNVLVTGEICAVAGTPFDFRKPKAIGVDIERARGYDLCYAINQADGSLRAAAMVREPKTGRVMEVLTTEPGVQLYTAEHFDGGAGCGGFGKRHAFCLECQHFPDSPNHAEFPSTALRPGEKYTQTTVHRFSVG